VKNNQESRLEYSKMSQISVNENTFYIRKYLIFIINKLSKIKKDVIMKYLSCFIFLLVLSDYSICQTNFYSFGNKNPIEWIMSFEIIDSETHLPLQNSSVSIYRDDGYRMATLSTDSYGIAVIIVKQISFFQDGEIKVIQDNYRPWQMKYSQSQFYQRSYSSRVYFPNSEIIWSDLNSIPSDRWISDKIQKKEYGIWKEYNSRYSYDGPGIYEYTIRLERIHGFSRHDGQNLNYNTQGEQVYNESFSLYRGELKTYQLRNINGFELEFTAKNNFIDTKGEKYITIGLLSTNSNVELLSLRSNGASVKQYRKIYIEDLSGYGVLDDLKEGKKFRIKILFERMDYSTSKATYWLNGSYKGSIKVNFPLDNCKLIFNEKVGKSFLFTEVSINTQ
jgi:hypothetical protein